MTSLAIDSLGLLCALGEDSESVVGSLRQQSNEPQDVRVGESQFPYFRLRSELDVYQLVEQSVARSLSASSLTHNQRRRMGVFVGTSASEISVQEMRLADDLEKSNSPLILPKSGLGQLADYIAQTFDIYGPRVCFSTACSSSANALLHAAGLIRAGAIDHALITGVEALNQLSVAGFNALLLYSQTRCMPFDLLRDGLVLGEGAGTVILSCDSNSHWGFFLGGANACDTQSVTSSSPDHIAQVMRAALGSAKLEPEDLAAIKAHGTGTPANDVEEGRAILSLGLPSTPVFALKPSLGHTLGACGVIELICCLLCMRENFLPATRGFRCEDPGIGLVPSLGTIDYSGGPLLLNSFGFGGNNTSLVVMGAG